eukprot:sb/3466173/
MSPGYSWCTVDNGGCSHLCFHDTGLAGVRPCNVNEFTCSDGSCIFTSYICDGARDCPEGEDEQQNCPRCREGLFDCEDNKTCLTMESVCDGVIQCYSNGLDERDCHACKKNERRCNDGQCRSAVRWCDRVPDCPDRSDERDCPAGILPADTAFNQNHLTAAISIIGGTVVLTFLILFVLYRRKMLPRIRTTYKQLTQSSNKTVETNLCMTTNTYSEIETTVCSSESAWRNRDHRSNNGRADDSCSDVSSMLNTQNPYERFNIDPVKSTTDVSIAGTGPAPSVVSGRSGLSGSTEHSVRSRSRSVSDAEPAFLSDTSEASDPDLVAPRFSDRKNFPPYRRLTVFDPDLVATPI